MIDSVRKYVAGSIKEQELARILTDQHVKMDRFEGNLKKYIANNDRKLQEIAPKIYRELEIGKNEH